MTKLKAIAAIAVLFLALLSLAACGAEDPGETTAPGFEIRFSVGDSVTAVTAKEGELPVFAGSTERAPDFEKSIYYRFTGWDREIVPASGNASYTAQYEQMPLCTVMWDVDNGIRKTYVGEGMIPAVPDGATDTVLKNDKIRTFAAWNKEITAATTGVNLYKAVYSDETRYYTVIFKIDGAEVATARAEYNQLAYRLYPGGARIPVGYGDVMWVDGNVKVREDNLVVNGRYVATNGQSLSTAYTTPLLGYSYNGASLMNDNGDDSYAEASAILYMMHEIRNTQNPDETTEMILDRCVASLQNLVNGKNTAPCFDLAPTWSYVPISGAILLAKHTPAVWDRLSASEKEQLTFIMEVLAYVLTLGTDDNNSYTTGPGMMGNYNKTWNPNYRLANVIPMLFIGKYFGGAAKVNQMLHAFSYDATVAKFEEYSFTRAYVNWTKPDPIHPTTGKALPGTKTFMENGGPAYTKARGDDAGMRLGITEGKAAGSGVGVRTDYTYGGYNIDNVAAIIGKLFDYNYSGGSIRSDWDTNGDRSPEAFILDKTKSPYEGMPGMMLEFGNGGRSSVSYCLDDFLMVITSLYILEEFDMYDLASDPARLKKVWAGNQDFIYKYVHGYRSISGYGMGGDSYERNASGHYFIWKEIWMQGFGSLSYGELPQ